jgi:hypothetical protein
MFKSALFALTGFSVFMLGSTFMIAGVNLMSMGKPVGIVLFTIGIIIAAFGMTITGKCLT